MLPGELKLYMNEQVQWPGIRWCNRPEKSSTGYLRHINIHTIIIIIEGTGPGWNHKKIGDFISGF